MVCQLQDSKIFSHFPISIYCLIIDIRYYIVRFYKTKNFFHFPPISQKPISTYCLVVNIRLYGMLIVRLKTFLPFSSNFSATNQHILSNCNLNVRLYGMLVVRLKNFSSLFPPISQQPISIYMTKPIVTLKYKIIQYDSCKIPKFTFHFFHFLSNQSAYIQ